MKTPGNFRFGLYAVAFLLLVSCAETPSKPEADKLILVPVAFSSLPGWSSDHPKEVIPALAKSCQSLLKRSADTAWGVAGRASDWTDICTSIARQPPQNDEDASQFFETHFQPYAASGNNGSEGLFTGYYEAELKGSTQRGGIYQTPLYARPDDLISVDLGDFKPEWKGQHLVGKVDAHKLKPYDDRAAITKNSLSGRAKELLWVDDPIDAFFLAVQGSGRVRMTDGTVTRVGYDGANGHSYTAIGKAMADRDLIAKPVTMQAIRIWLKDHPDRANEIMNLNASYVFFRTIEGEGPIGAEGVVLTPLRSLAVDPNFVPLGVPLWLDTQDGHGAPLQRLMMAQDTGGAIKGPVRGDVFWGFGPDAATSAGIMQSRGHYYLLLPKSVHVAN